MVKPDVYNLIEDYIRLLPDDEIRDALMALTEKLTEIFEYYDAKIEELESP